jgi:hypothetical protein
MNKSRHCLECKFKKIKSQNKIVICTTAGKTFESYRGEVSENPECPYFKNINKDLYTLWENYNDI